MFRNFWTREIKILGATHPTHNSPPDHIEAGLPKYAHRFTALGKSGAVHLFHVLEKIDSSIEVTADHKSIIH